MLLTLRESLGLDSGSSHSETKSYNADLRRLDDFMVSECISLPGSSNTVAVKYTRTSPDLQWVQFFREKQDRATAGTMECQQLINVDTSAWADRYRKGD